MKKKSNKNIFIKGAKLHNLKNIDVEIPRNKLTVITGLSGSGKSSLAFDTLYAEGQRKYVESLSSYARQFLGKLDKPKVDYISGISPAIAIEQKVNTTNPRSTVGTSTEIYDYLKLLYSRIGITYSPISNKRNDKYGGSFENRIRFALEIITEIKSVWPKNKPLFYRLSSIDTPGEGATIDDNVKLSKALKLAGIDVVDCSSGGITGSPVLTKSKIIPGFQVPYSEKIKKEANINSMAVGAIISADQANDIILKNRADLVALGRELLADTQWVYKAATHFNLEDAKSYLPDSYSFYLSRRDEFLDRSAKPA